MAKYLLLKHYRGGPAPVVDIDPMDQWAPAEVDAHVQWMRDFATRLEESGEFVDHQALSPEGTFVRYGGEGRPPVTDGPFAETKDLIAGWLIIDVETLRASHRGGGRRTRPRRARAASRSTNGWRSVRSTAPRPPSRSERNPAAGADSRGHRRPRPSRSRLRDGRGRRAGRAAAGTGHLADGAAGGSEGLVDHGRLAQVPGRDPGGELPARPRGPGHGRATARPDRGHGRHAAALLPVRPPVAHAGLRGGAHAAGGGRPDDAPDRAGVPGARGDHGPADQPGQAHRVGRALRRARRPGHRPAGALPGLQRGLQRRGRPRRRGDPADPPGAGR